MAQDVPIILGGHTFISQLGNEPKPSLDAQREIVRACLDNGLTWFDTTHRPEREGLGRALESLGRRKEATIIAWNFLGDVGSGPNDKLDSAAPYEPTSIDDMLAQLRTDHIDCLVVHDVNTGRGRDADKEANARQEELAVSWQKTGLAKRLGVWESGGWPEARYGKQNPYAFMLAPYNIARRNTSAEFAGGRRMGWETYATSPFIRGWELDKMVAKARKLDTKASEPALRGKLADLMLRWVLSDPRIDRVVCAMRRPEWVPINAASAKKGPLSIEERAWLDTVRATG